MQYFALILNVFGYFLSAQGFMLPNGNLSTDSLDNVCAKGGQYHADPYDCHYFIQCSNGIPYRQKCAIPLYWNQKRLTCQWSNEHCTEQTATTAETTFKTEAVTGSKTTNTAKLPNASTTAMAATTTAKTTTRADITATTIPINQTVTTATTEHITTARPERTMVSLTTTKMLTSSCTKTPVEPTTETHSETETTQTAESLPETSTSYENTTGDKTTSAAWNTTRHAEATTKSCAETSEASKPATTLQLTDSSCEEGEITATADCEYYRQCIEEKMVLKKCPEATYWNQIVFACTIDNSKCFETTTSKEVPATEKDTTQKLPFQTDSSSEITARSETTEQSKSSSTTDTTASTESKTSNQETTAENVSTAGANATTEADWATEATAGKYSSSVTEGHTNGSTGQQNTSSESNASTITSSETSANNSTTLIISASESIERTFAAYARTDSVPSTDSTVTPQTTDDEITTAGTEASEDTTESVPNTHETTLSRTSAGITTANTPISSETATENEADTPIQSTETTESIITANSTTEINLSTIETTLISDTSTASSDSTKDITTADGSMSTLTDTSSATESQTTAQNSSSVETSTSRSASSGSTADTTIDSNWSAEDTTSTSYQTTTEANAISENIPNDITEKSPPITSETVVATATTTYTRNLDETTTPNGSSENNETSKATTSNELTTSRTFSSPDSATTTPNNSSEPSTNETTVTHASTICQTNGIEYHADPNNCTQFIECVNGQANLLTCPELYYWAVEQKLCVRGKCHENFNQNDTIFMQYWTTPLPDSVTMASTSTSFESKFCLTNDTEYHVHPEDCNKFIQCINGQAYGLSCPQSYYWDKEQEACSLGDCQQTASQFIDTTAQSLTTIGLSLCTGSPLEFHANPDDCSKFIECVDGQPYELQCPSSYYWNGERQSCVLGGCPQNLILEEKSSLK